LEQGPTPAHGGGSPKVKSSKPNDLFIHDLPKIIWLDLVMGADKTSALTKDGKNLQYGASVGGSKTCKKTILQVFLMTDDEFWTLHLEKPIHYRNHLSVCYSASLTPPPGRDIFTLVKPFSFV
jgi:hypothetical protein